jgi:hypothetical protein
MSSDFISCNLLETAFQKVKSILEQDIYFKSDFDKATEIGKKFELEL